MVSATLKSVTLLSLIIISGCSSLNSSSATQEKWNNELEVALESAFPKSEWGVTKTTLYNPSAILTSSNNVMIKLDGVTWDHNGRRYKYKFSAEGTLYRDSESEKLFIRDLKNFSWNCREVPNLRKQEIIDLTLPIIVSTLSEGGLDLK